MRYWDESRIHNKRRKNPRKGRSLLASGGNLRNSPFLRKFYQHGAEISEGLQKFVFFLIIASLLFAFIFGDSGAIRILTLNHKQALLEKNISKLKQRITMFEKEINRLKNDPFYTEKLGREKYGYIRPGDKVYKIIPLKEKE